MELFAEDAIFFLTCVRVELFFLVNRVNRLANPVFANRRVNCNTFESVGFYLVTHHVFDCLDMVFALPRSFGCFPHPLPP